MQDLFSHYMTLDSTYILYSLKFHFMVRSLPFLFMANPESITKNIINIMWLQMEGSPTLATPDLRIELSSVRIDISNLYPNTIDSSKPTLT